MAMGSIVGLHEIPFFDLSEATGRFFSSAMFYDAGEWRMWMSIGEDKYIETKAWPAEGFYYGRSAELKTDLHLHFLDFIAQRASFLEIQKPLMGLRDDYFNLSASLAKITHIHETKATLKTGDGRMVITEIEYLFSVCRSMMDLLQEIAAKLWEKIELLEPFVSPKKKLKSSFNEMLWFEGRPTTQLDLQRRFGLPPLWVDFYLLHMDFFLLVKNFRDNIIHNGSQVQTIFSSEDGYLINSSLRPFADMDIWTESEINKNILVPLMPALGMVVYRTILTCEEFTVMLEKCISFPKPLAPDMKLYMRGFFDEHFAKVLGDAEDRFRQQMEAKGIK
jgi:hypothetical protein